MRISDWSSDVCSSDLATAAVFGSWHSERAKVYRRLNHISGDWGTAVNVQAMVFGIMGDTSATGVAFTRDPSTDRKSVVEGKSVSVRVDLGGRRIIKKKT